MPAIVTKKELEMVRRKTARRIAACIVSCMADTDTGFDVIAHKIGQDESTVRRWLYDFIEGRTGGGGLDDLSKFSDVLLAMGAEPVFRVQRYEPPPLPEQEAQTA